MSGFGLLSLEQGQALNPEPLHEPRTLKNATITTNAFHFSYQYYLK